MKYGRLFTEEEVDELIGTFAHALLSKLEAVAHGDREKASTKLVEIAIGVKAELQACFPADEPTFVLRGQDLHAPAAVRAYRDRLQDEGDNEGALAVDEALKGMRGWQRANPERVKLPSV